MGINNFELTWQESHAVCALADSDRHLGHLIRRGKWYAYDGTRLDEESQSFRCLGAFPDVASAKRAVELAAWGEQASQAAQ